MSETEFVHLHNHSDFSELDGANRVTIDPELKKSNADLKTMVDRAKELGQTALAITDHGVMSGAIEFYEACRKADIKPIIGYEAYLAASDMHDREKTSDLTSYHLTLLAENIQGYQNLMKLSSKGWLEGYHGKGGISRRPRVDFNALAQHSEGVIALSGCLSGHVLSALKKEDYEGARQAVSTLKDIFGPERFYIELQRHGIEEQEKTMKDLLQLAKEFGLATVATNDAHYTEKDDWEAHDILLCLNSNSVLNPKDKEGNPKKRFKFDSQEFYLKSGEEMARLFPETPEAIKNTLIVAERVDIALPLGKTLLPSFPTPANRTAVQYITELVEAGLHWRFGDLTSEQIERAERELEVITQMGFSDYFLIVWDFRRWARENGVGIGPGRGSAGGSLVAYCLGITDVNPLEHGLLFERFLNKERYSMPDIDCDFSVEGREKVINYVREKYGHGKVAQIITFNTIGPKAAIRDVGRVMEFARKEIDTFSKEVPITQGKAHPLAMAIGESPVLREAYSNQNRPELHKLFEVAKTLEGMVRNPSKHAAGVVISSENLEEFTPLQLGKDGVTVVTQYDMNSVSKVGLLKMDFLGLANLDLIKRCLDLIKLDHGIEINMDRLNFDDAKTFELLCAGRTLGVFQLESPGMRRLLQDLQPQAFADIAAVNALFRPGPMQNIPQYVSGRHGRIEVSYDHPKLEPILRETYGVMIYQEQVMMTARELAGFSMNEADILRAAMGKKDKVKMAEQKTKFIEGCKSHSAISEKDAESLFTKIAQFAEYGFPKAHAVEYGIIAYWTAYLKANYPLEFLCCLLNQEAQKGTAKDKLPLLLAECRQQNIQILPPDINKSEVDFSVDEKTIRWGLGAISNCRAGVAEAVVIERKANGEYVGVRDLCERLAAVPHVTVKPLEALVLSGSCDHLHRLPSGEYVERKRLYLSLSKVWDEVRNRLQKGVQQVDLFSLSQLGSQDDLPAPQNTPPYTKAERLQNERDYLGVYLSGHPLTAVVDELILRVDYPISEVSVDLAKIKDERKRSINIRIGGLVREARSVVTKKKDIMGKALLEDENGATIGVTIFARNWNQLRDIFIVDKPIIIEGSVQEESVWAGTADAESEADEQVEVKPGIICNQAWVWEDALKLEPRIEREVYVDLPSKAGAVEELGRALRRHPGKDKVMVGVLTSTNTHRAIVEAGEEFMVNSSPELIAELSALCGQAQVHTTRTLDKVIARASAGHELDPGI